jgi:hypothetical protein
MLLTAERIGPHDELSDRAFETKTMGVDHLPRAIDLVVGTAERADLEARIEAAIQAARVPEPAPRRHRRPSLASTIKQAKRGGADRVEVDPRSGRIVIPLAGAAPGESAANAGSDELEDWISKHADEAKGS